MSILFLLRNGAVLCCPSTPPLLKSDAANAARAHHLCSGATHRILREHTFSAQERSIFFFLLEHTSSVQERRSSYCESTPPLLGSTQIALQLATQIALQDLSFCSGQSMFQVYLLFGRCDGCRECVNILQYFEECDDCRRL